MILNRLAWTEINLSAYAYNILAIKKYIGSQVKLMAVVKGNGFGHGAIPFAKKAESLPVDYLGVVCLYEAKQLRKAQIQLPILILNYIDSEAAKEAVDLDVAITVMDKQVLTEINDYAKKQNKKAVVHIKIDTGMHRAGIPVSEAEELIDLSFNLKNVTLEGIFTHFATADEKDASFVWEQKRLFDEILDKLKKKNITIPIIHAANSAATLRFPETHYNMVRPGIATCGLSPSGMPLTKDIKYGFDPQPALSFKTKIVQIRTIPAGDTVGYGRTFVAKRTTKVGLLPVGYADGFRRGSNNWGHVLIRGKFAPIIGRVSMDLSSIDITDISDVEVDDEVVLLGKQGRRKITAEEIAEKVGTNCHEVVSLITARVPRIYI